MTSRRTKLGSVVFAILLVTSVFSVATFSVAAADGASTSGGYAVTQAGECYEVTSFGDGSQNVSEFYDYRTPDTDPVSYTYSSFGTTDMQANQVSNLFVYNGSEGASLVMLHDKLDDNGTGDGLYGSTVTFNISGLPEDREWAVEDDSYGNDTDDNFTHSATSSRIDWKWADNRTDGAAVRGLDSDGYENVTIDPGFNEEAAAWGDWSWSGDENNRTETWRLLTADGQNVTLNRSQDVKIRSGPCDVTDPTASLTTNASSTAAGTPVEFDASNSSDNENVSEFRWDFDGDGEVDESTDDSMVTHAYEAVGEYEATVTVVDGSGNTATDNATVNVTDEQAPDAVADVPDEVMANESFTADANASTDNGAIVSYDWTFGDGTNASGANVSHTYASNGTYNVTLTVTDSGGNNDSTTTQVEVIEPDEEPPTAALTADPTDASVGTEVTLDASNATDNRRIVAYRWDFDGDGEVDNTTRANVTSHVYTAVGTYDATVTVVDVGGNEDTANATVNVTDEQAPDAVADVPETVGANASFAADASASTDNGDIASYEWAFGDNTTKTGEVVTHAYAEPGTYNVTLTVTDTADNENATTATVNVTENETSEAPTANLTVDPASPMANQPVVFDANESSDDGQIAKYYWDFDGDGSVDETTDDPTVTHTYEANGTYDATVTVRDEDGLTDAATVSVDVAADDESDKPPTAMVDAPDFAHVGDKRLYDASDSVDDTGIVKYIWDFNGDGDTRTTPDPTAYHRYSYANYQKATLTVVDESGQSDTVQFEVNVVDNQKPTATLMLPDTVNVGEEFPVNATISDNGAVPTIEWKFDGKLGAEEQNTTWAFDEPGTHPVTLKLVDTGGNVFKETRNVTVKRKSSGGNGGNDGGHYDGGHHDDNDDTTVDVDDDDDDWTKYTVDGATEEKAVTMKLPATVGDSDIRYGELRLLFASGGDYELSVQPTATAPDGTAVPTPDADGFELLSYLTVDSQPQLTDETVANATFSFAVGNDRLSAMDAETGDVSLYQLTNGSWERVPTELVGETDEATEFAANPSEMTVFAVGVDRPSIQVTDVELDSSSVEPGETVDVTATIANDGRANGTFAANLTVDGEVIDTREVTVPAGESVTATFTHAVDSAGSHELIVGDATASLDVAGAASMRVTDLSVGASSVTAGDTVEITATVANDGAAEGTYTAELTLDGEVVDTREVTVPAGESAAVTFTRSVDEAGSYELSVGDATAQVDVQSANAATEATPGSDGNIPGFGPVAALLALVGAALLARRRL